MARLTKEELIFIVKTFYKNNESIVATFRALRERFGVHNRPTKQAISKIIKRFESIGSVQVVKRAARPRPVRTRRNIEVVKESVAEHPNTSTRVRSQELGLSRTTLLP